MRVTEAKHTPGPWRVAKSSAYDAQMGEIGHTVCVVIGDKIIHMTHNGFAGKPDDYRQQRANAHLIAAAPEMYEALQRYEQAERLEAEMGGEQIVANAYREARQMRDAALRKARGDAS